MGETSRNYAQSFEEMAEAEEEKVVVNDTTESKDEEVKDEPSE